MNRCRWKTVATLLILLVAATKAQAQIKYSSTLTPDGQQFHLNVSESAPGGLFQLVNNLNLPAISTPTGFAKNFALDNGQLTIDCYVANASGVAATTCDFGLRNGNDMRGQNDWTLGHISSFQSGRVAHILCSGIFERQAHALLPLGSGANGAYQFVINANASITYSDKNGAAEFNLVSDL